MIMLTHVAQRIAANARLQPFSYYNASLKLSKLSRPGHPFRQHKI